jgi:hypothetical protein
MTFGVLFWILGLDGLRCVRATLVTGQGASRESFGAGVAVHSREFLPIDDGTHTYEYTADLWEVKIQGHECS